MVGLRETTVKAVLVFIDCKIDEFWSGTLAFEGISDRHEGSWGF